MIAFKWRRFFALLVILVATTSAWASAKTKIVGTWQLMSVHGQPAPDEVYVQLQADGTILSWPNSNPNRPDGVSAQTYVLRGNELMVMANEGERGAIYITNFKLSGDTLTTTAADGSMVYQRQKNPPMPGAFRSPKILADGAAPDPTLSMAQLEDIASSLEPKLGRYPLHFASEADAKATRATWARATASAERLGQQQPESEQLLALLARLHRQGNNLDARGSYERAEAILRAGLRAHPDSIPLNFEASYFYLQADPSHIEGGKKATLKLRELLRTDQNVDVEEQLAFAYLFAGSKEQALAQIDHFLAIVPAGEKAAADKKPRDDRMKSYRQRVIDGTFKTMFK